MKTHPVMFVITPKIDYGTLIVSSNPAKVKLIRMPRTYMHGTLERNVGYDVFYFINVTPTEPGIYPVSVVRVKGKPVRARLYVWHSGGSSDSPLIGLVVATTDRTANAYAQRMYNQCVLTI